jgi:hypothetical protein
MTHVENLEEDLCESCTGSSGVFICEGCGNSYTEGAYGGSVHDENYCDSCYENVEEESEEESEDRPIEGYHDHSRKWNRFGTAARGVYYGVELEAICDKGHDDFQSVAEYIKEQYGTIGGYRGEFLFTENDSSLKDRGYETVFHPMAPEFLSDKENRAMLTRLLKNMAERHMVSYDANDQNISAGMHVTLSWDALRNWERQKFLELIFKNKKLTTLVSRRRQEDLDKYARVSPPVEPISRMVMKKEGYGAKYVAINLKKPDSESRVELAEVRIFRGTLKPESFFMNLEFVIACVELARDVHYGLNDMTKDNLLNYIWLHEKTYPNIFAWLREKKLLAQRTKPIPEKFRKPPQGIWSQGVR